MVKSYAKTICLRDNPVHIAQYKRHHSNVWPEVLKALKEVGILQMKIFLIGKRVCVFTYEYVYTTKETFVATASAQYSLLPAAPVLICDREEQPERLNDAKIQTHVRQLSHGAAYGVLSDC